MGGWEAMVTSWFLTAVASVLLSLWRLDRKDRRARADYEAARDLAERLVGYRAPGVLDAASGARAGGRERESAPARPRPNRHRPRIWHGLA